jgi:hypothetical protein
MPAASFFYVKGEAFLIGAIHHTYAGLAPLPDSACPPRVYMCHGAAGYIQRREA